MSLNLLHLSDIHFTKENPLDLDNDLRNEIERDLILLKAEFNNIDAVLVGGDIAFSGSISEYENAYKWLNKICNTVGCPVENVLTVPGNHDVDRSKVTESILDIHNVLKKLNNRVRIDEKLKRYLDNKDDINMLLKPLQNYQNFAQRYGSSSQENDCLFWEKDFQLNGAKLRVRGINSAIVSDKNDDFETSKLIVGSHQSKIKRQDGIIYCVLCHHPPDWLYDGNEVNTDFISRAKLHLYGHKHKIDVVKQNESLKISAGAVHPTRTDDNWEPRYNVISLDIIQKENSFFLRVKVWRRVWSDEDTRFKADFDVNGSAYRQYDLLLEDTELEKTPLTPSVASINELDPKDVKVEIIIPSSDNIELINTKKVNPVRKLMYMFFSLPYHTKIELAVHLSLIEDEDFSLNELEKTRKYFQRVQERNLYSELWNLVTSKNEDKLIFDNPFVK